MSLSIGEVLDSVMERREALLLLRRVMERWKVGGLISLIDFSWRKCIE